MLTAAADTREQTLWAQEVERVLTAAPTLSPLARASLRATLGSLAAETPAGSATGRDIVAMLAALDASAPRRKRLLFQRSSPARVQVEDYGLAGAHPVAPAA